MTYFRALALILSLGFVGKVEPSAADLESIVLKNEIFHPFSN